MILLQGFHTATAISLWQFLVMLPILMTFLNIFCWQKLDDARFGIQPVDDDDGN